MSGRVFDRTFLYLSNARWHGYDDPRCDQLPMMHLLNEMAEHRFGYLEVGYHAVLLSLAAMKGASEDELIDHTQAIARDIPLVGFYLQPAVGGIVLPVSFWRRFAAIENVVAIKIAPFNRYRTLDVVRGVVEAGAADRITLYTGNDDHIVLDLATPFTVTVNGQVTTVRIKGGLLGHWSVWVKSAVDLLERIHAAVESGPIPADLLALDSQVTDCNAASS